MTTLVQSGILVYQEDFITLVSYDHTNTYGGKVQGNVPVKGELHFERFEYMANVMILRHDNTGLRFRASWVEVARWLTGDTVISIKQAAGTHNACVYGTFVMNREGHLEEYIGKVDHIELDELDDLQ